ncbi:MAG: hypothetical protein MI861_06475, partial [Pirellulales bacterium]|nr:hypothetical protein [Pirellulales bacterium]
ARPVAELAGLDRLPACRIEVIERPPPHSGLGSGTQLGLAAAEALCRFTNLSPPTTQLACEIAGRGHRSAVGVHGYFQGGMIYEGRDNSSPLNRVLRRVELSPQWRVALFRPRASSAPVSGAAEKAQFSKLNRPHPSQRASLEALLCEQLLPAAASGDFDVFAAAIQQYNHQSGQLFEAVQGGPYNGPAVAKLVQELIARGAHGVGQSSWGPTVFAWFESPQQADDFVSGLPVELAHWRLSRPRNRGRLSSPIVANDAT